MRTRVGYAGGSTPDPTYSRLGDHTESVEIDYDPRVISYDDLLNVFWTSHDPRRSGRSAQYRSAIFYRTDAERVAAEASKARVEERVGRVATSIEPLPRFYRAEDYHQKYYLRSERSLMAELREIHPDDRRFADSTVAARLNGWLDGCASPGSVARDLPALGLSDEAVARLRSRLLRASTLTP